MAIQFPNFLQAPIVKPDYSGLGDAISNYYGGKNLPRQDLINAVKAHFAQPLAEATIANTNASAQKSKAEANKMQMIVDYIQHITNPQPQGNGNQNPSQAPNSNGGAPGDLAQTMLNRMLIGEAQTPEQKQNTDIQTATIKAQEIPTRETSTRYRFMTDKAPELYESIEDLLTMNRFSPSFKKKLQNSAEAFAKVSQFPIGKEGIDRAEAILTPGPLETHEAYEKRINEQLGRLAPEIETAHKFIKKDLPKRIQKYLKVKIKAPNGTVYSIPYSDADAAIKAGGIRV